MSSRILCGLCALLLISLGVASDVPFVFDKDTSGIASYTFAQLEQSHISSPDIIGVPPITSAADNEILSFPMVGGGSDSRSAITRKAGEYKKIFDARVEPDTRLVHDEALLLVAKYPGDYTIDQVCSIYSYLKAGEGPIRGWSYIEDPRGLDYFNYANESLRIGDKSGCSGAGDCDDFAILMSALMESIGGTTRIILAHNNTTGGHAYTEVYLGGLNSSNNQVDNVIDWLKKKYNTDKIFIHIDTDTKDVWLNLDWGPDKNGIAHPGGPFYMGDKHIVVCIRDELERTPLKLQLPSIEKEGAIQSTAVPLDITINETESNSTEVWYNKGFALYSLGKYDEAIKSLDKAIEINPLLAGAWSNKAAALINLGRYDKALQADEKAIQIDPNLAAAWINKGEALKRQGKYDEAIQALDKFIQLNPQYALAWNNKAGALMGLGRNDEANESLEKAIQIDPNFAAAWCNKGIVLGRQGKYDEAIKALDKAIKLIPQFADAWSNKGETLRRQGEYDEAIQALDKSIQLNPQDALAWNSKGAALGQLGKYDKAIQCFDEAIKINPQYAGAWNNKGIALKLLDRATEANDAFAKARELGYISSLS